MGMLCVSMSASASRQRSPSIAVHCMYDAVRERLKMRRGWKAVRRTGERNGRGLKRSRTGASAADRLTANAHTMLNRLSQFVDKTKVKIKAHQAGGATDATADGTPTPTTPSAVKDDADGDGEIVPGPTSSAVSPF
jgi:hypothetical protein